MPKVKYLTEASLFGQSADTWAQGRNILDTDNNLLLLSFANNLSELTDSNQARINLGLRIGIDVQPSNANLNLYAGAKTPTSFSLDLLSNIDDNQWRNALNAGTVRNIQVDGGSTGLVFLGGPVTDVGVITMDGVLKITNGGTGANNKDDAKINLGLDKVDNVRDIDKPISTATATALAGKFNNPNGNTTQYIRGDGTLSPFPTIPPQGIGSVISVDVFGGTTGLNFSGGPVTRTGTITLGGILNISSGGTGTTSLSQFKSNLNLDKLDNTADMDKPISNAVQNALNKTVKIPASVSTNLTLPNPVNSNLIAWSSDGLSLINVDPSQFITTLPSSYPASIITTTNFSAGLIPNGSNVQAALQVLESATAALQNTQAQLPNALAKINVYPVNGTDYDLGYNPGSINNLTVILNGINQIPGDDYTLVGNIVRFNTAPPAGKIVIHTLSASRIPILSPVVDRFIGNGVKTVFTLSINPGVLENIDVVVGGVSQYPTDDYTLSNNTTLTFNSPPPDQAKIFCRYYLFN